MRPALIVSSFPNDFGMEIANVVYVAPDEILYPVPRSLYTLDPLQRAYMSKSQCNKMTTVLSEGSVVTVQVDSKASKVTCMMKGGTGLFGLDKRGSDWMMDVDVAVSDEQPRQVFVCSPFLPGTLMKTLINLNDYLPNKPYRGTVKLNVFHGTIASWASMGIFNFVYWQKHFKEADRACFEFSLTNIYETDEPNIAVVYEASWQSVKRSIVLTPAQVGDVPDDELNLLLPVGHVHPIDNCQSKQGPSVKKFIENIGNQQGKKAGSIVTSVVSENNGTDKQQKQKDSVMVPDHEGCQRRLQSKYVDEKGIHSEIGWEGWKRLH
ncbi:hypothetical protein niasHS_014667 [Heterodera schachtii]|uniref:Uncharacterized protein n=1 Tax=Heterodera schachtii TaxID=97005 RepID=A0ABD2INN7_HETSC